MLTAEGYQSFLWRTQAIWMPEEVRHSVEDARYRFFEAIARLLAPANLRKLPAA